MLCAVNGGADGGRYATDIIFCFGAYFLSILASSLASDNVHRNGRQHLASGSINARHLLIIMENMPLHLEKPTVRTWLQVKVNNLLAEPCVAYLHSTA